MYSLSGQMNVSILKWYYMFFFHSINTYCCRNNSSILNFNIFSDWKVNLVGTFEVKFKGRCKFRTILNFYVNCGPGISILYIRKLRLRLFLQNQYFLSRTDGVICFFGFDLKTNNCRNNVSMLIKFSKYYDSFYLTLWAPHTLYDTKLQINQWVSTLHV